MTWLSTTRTTMSMAASSSLGAQLDVVRRDPVDETALAVDSSAPACVVSSGSSSVSAPWVAETIALQQQVVLGGLEHRARRVADRGDQVGRVGVEGDRDQPEEPLQLAQDHRLGEQRLRADLVVDRLPADPDHVGQPGHRHLGPAGLGGQRHGRVDDALTHRHRRRGHGHERYGAQRAGSRSRGRSRPSRGRRSRGSTSCPARRPRPSRPRSPRARRRPRPRRRSRSPGTGRRAPRPARPARPTARRSSTQLLVRGRRVRREDLVALAGRDVRQAQVAVEVVEHPRVHHPPPDGGHDREDDHPGVPGRQHRGLLVVAQGLVAPGRVGVVVAVPLQVVEQHVGRDVVGVPGVRGVDPLVALPLADADLLAQHPVVLHVVDDLEQREADDGLDDEVGQRSRRPARRRARPTAPATSARR